MQSAESKEIGTAIPQAKTEWSSSTQCRPAIKKSKPMSNLRPLSHSLSKVLRHTALEWGFKMTPDGYVPVKDILVHPHFKKYSLQDIEEVVRTNDKQRFKLEEKPAINFNSSYCRDPSVSAKNNDHDDDDDNKMVLCIRANQGHSINFVDPDLLLQRLEPTELMKIPTVVHGTYMDAWKSIQNQGLKRMKRNHIHFATGLPKDNGVISGMRKSCQVYIYIDAKKCAEDGVVFYKSNNGVLLTAGPKDEGTLSSDYFLRVTDSLGNDLT
jgi:2'-phosphotransferase